MTPTQIQDTALLVMMMIICGLMTWLVVRDRYLRRFSKLKAETAALVSELQQERIKLKTHNQILEKQLSRMRQKGDQLAEERTDLIRKLAMMQSRTESLQSSLAHLEVCEASLVEYKEKLSEMKQHSISREVTLSKDLEVAQRQLRETTQMRDYLEKTYRQLSSQALQENAKTLIRQVESAFSQQWQGARHDLKDQAHAVQQAIRPLQSALAKYETQLNQLEASRQKAYGGLTEKLKDLSTAQASLEKETTRLVQSLKSPQVKGRWGEISLKRAVEMAGLSRYCDFVEQSSNSVDGEKEIRPDMIVMLPNSRTLVLDAKVSLAAYLDAQVSKSPERQERLLKKHAQQLRQHVRSLSSKAYWRQFETTPDYVIMFIPGENFFSAALSVDPQLIDDASRKNVIITTPTTLISLLKTVYYVWQQDNAAQNARQILAAGRTAFQRIQTMTNHFTTLGKDLSRCVKSFNRTVASYEHRVLASARNLQELGVTEVSTVPLSEPVKLIDAVRIPADTPE